MNKQIKQFVEQAGFLNKDEESIENFAELIIRECINYCESQVLASKPGQRALTYNDGMMDCALGLLQHFGFEE